MEKNKQTAFFALSVLGMMILLLAGLMFGTVTISLPEVLRTLTAGKPQDSLYRILYHVRLPRVAGAMLCGSSFAVAGAVIQAVLANPLASPNTIGSNAGAGLFVLLTLAFCPGVPALLPAAAFAGALFAAGIVLAVCSGGQTRLNLILAGFAVTSMLNAGMNAVLIVAPDIYAGAGAFLAGGLSGLTFEQLRWPACYILPGLLIAGLCGRGLNLLSMGQETASALGMQVPFWRLFYLLLAAVLAGAAVSFSGLIGFVGLVIPHITRSFTGHNHTLLIPACAIWGACFVLLCDLASRLLFAPYELPAGLIMAFLGSPFFLYLIIQNRKAADD